MISLLTILIQLPTNSLTDSKFSVNSSTIKPVHPDHSGGSSFIHRFELDHSFNMFIVSLSLMQIKRSLHSYDFSTHNSHANTEEEEIRRLRRRRFKKKF